MWEQVIAWIKSKDYNRAITECQDQILIAKKTGQAQNEFAANIYLAIIYTNQHKFDLSKNIFDRYYEKLIISYANKWPGQELIKTYLHYHEIKMALQYNDAFLTYNTAHISALQTRGVLLFKLKEYSSSNLALSAALKLGGNSPELFFTYAMVKKEQNENSEAINYLEKAFLSGMDQSVYEIFKIIFRRKGLCDYSNCTDTCCKKLVLNGIDGLPIKSQYDMENLILSDKKHKCWIKVSELENGSWVFNCHNNDEKNNCHDYNNRPDLCRDYPSHPLTLKKACSYTFELIPELARFKSQNFLDVICDILIAYELHEEEKIIKDINSDISE